MLHNNSKTEHVATNAELILLRAQLTREPLAKKSKVMIEELKNAWFIRRCLDRPCSISS